LSKSQGRGLRTGRKRLLELLGLVAVLEDKGVEIVAAADLELDLLVGVLLHAHSCRKPYNQPNVHNWTFKSSNPSLSSTHVSQKFAGPVFPPESMLFLQSTSFQGSWAKRTGSILAAADLDEALDVGDFAGHVGGIV
jgi:hypothetical protein